MMRIIYDNGYWWVAGRLDLGPFASKQAAQQWLKEQEA